MTVQVAFGRYCVKPGTWQGLILLKLLEHTGCLFASVAQVIPCLRLRFHLCCVYTLHTTCWASLFINLIHSEKKKIPSLKLFVNRNRHNTGMIKINELNSSA